MLASCAVALLEGSGCFACVLLGFFDWNWSAFACGSFLELFTPTNWPTSSTCLDYRVPQMLQALGVLVYSPPLEDCIKRKEEIPSGHSWELQLRGKLILGQDAFLPPLAIFWVGPFVFLHVHTEMRGFNFRGFFAGCSIWAVELIRRQIQRNHPEATVNAILIDFFLYDAMQNIVNTGQEHLPHHRTRSVWY